LAKATITARPNPIALDAVMKLLGNQSSQNATTIWYKHGLLNEFEMQICVNKG
jgi:hypothetical protein